MVLIGCSVLGRKQQGYRGRHLAAVLRSTGGDNGLHKSVRREERGYQGENKGEVGLLRIRRELQKGAARVT